MARPRSASPAVALAPLLRPQLLDVPWTRNEATQRAFTEFGGLQAPHRPFVPTAETACFMLAGDGLGLRLQAMRRLAPNARLLHDGLLQLAAPAGDGLGASTAVASALASSAASTVRSATLSATLSAAILPGARSVAEALPGDFASVADGIGLAASVATHKVKSIELRFRHAPANVHVARRRRGRELHLLMRSVRG